MHLQLNVLYNLMHLQFGAIYLMHCTIWCIYNLVQFIWCIVQFDALYNLMHLQFGAIYNLMLHWFQNHDCVYDFYKKWMIICFSKDYNAFVFINGFYQIKMACFIRTFGKIRWKIKTIAIDFIRKFMLYIYHPFYFITHSEHVLLLKLVLISMSAERGIVC